MLPDAMVLTHYALFSLHLNAPGTLAANAQVTQIAPTSVQLLSVIPPAMAIISVSQPVPLIVTVITEQPQNAFLVDVDPAPQIQIVQEFHLLLIATMESVAIVILTVMMGYIVTITSAQYAKIQMIQAAGGLFLVVLNKIKE